MELASNSKKTETFFRPKNYNLEDGSTLSGSLIITQMVRKQQKNRFFNGNAFHLNFRKNLIASIKHVIGTFNYSGRTFFLAVAILDAILSLHSVEEEQLRMLIIISVHLAAKVEEPFENIPELKDFCKKYSKKLTTKDLKVCEQMVFQILDYSPNIVTSAQFAHEFVYRGVVVSRDFKKPLSNKELNTSMDILEKLIKKLLIIHVDYYEFYQFTTLAVGAAVIGCARLVMGFENVWNIYLEKLTRVSFDSIEHIVELLYKRTKLTHPKIVEEFKLPCYFFNKETVLMEGVWGKENSRKTTGDVNSFDNSGVKKGMEDTTKMEISYHR